MLRPLLLVALLIVPLVGCTTQNTAPATGTPSYQSMGFDGKTWPKLNGTTLTILDHGAFAAFGDAQKLFENMTGAKVEHVSADDAGSALNQAAREKGAPTVDIIYGIDNVLYTRAVQQGIFEPYHPLLASRIAPEYVFFDAKGPWYATPVDHGYIGVNVDERNVTGHASVATLADVRDHAEQFVTEDPRTSTPGLGFLLSTIATYPENSSYTWKQYWNDLFAHHVLVTSGWTEAYEQHFSGGYGVAYGGKADRAIVTSYTESPAYEHYFGAANVSTAMVVPNSTFHQIQTMGIVNGTKHLAAAQAWIEFTLTDDFQKLAAPGDAVYPVVKSVSVNDTYGGVDPAPGTFAPAAFDATTLGANVERYVKEWTALCEAANCG